MTRDDSIYYSKLTILWSFVLIVFILCSLGVYFLLLRKTNATSEQTFLSLVLFSGLCIAPPYFLYYRPLASKFCGAYAGLVVAYFFSILLFPVWVTVPVAIALVATGHGLRQWWLSQDFVINAKAEAEQQRKQQQQAELEAQQAAEDANLSQPVATETPSVIAQKIADKIVRKS